MSRKQVSLIHTPETWSILSKKAEEAHHGKGVYFYVDQELKKRLRDINLCHPCEFIKIEKVKINFFVYEPQLSAVDCLCARWGVDRATLINKLVIDGSLPGR